MPKQSPADNDKPQMKLPRGETQHQLTHRVALTAILHGAAVPFDEQVAAFIELADAPDLADIRGQWRCRIPRSSDHWAFLADKFGMRFQDVLDGKTPLLNLLAMEDRREAAPRDDKAEGPSTAYDPDAYMPVVELRESMDPPWNLGDWTKAKRANPWLRFDPTDKPKTSRPRIHRADAAKLKGGPLDPKTFELLDDDLPELHTLDEYAADAAARKAEIQEKNRRSGG